MEKVGIQKDAIERCAVSYKESLLDDQVRNVAWSPQALRINGWRYSGPLDPETVLKALCSGYVNQPTECSAFMEGGEVPFIHKTVGLSVRSAVLTFSFLIVTLVVVFWFYKTHVTKS